MNNSTLYIGSFLAIVGLIIFIIYLYKLFKKEMLSYSEHAKTIDEIIDAAKEINNKIRKEIITKIEEDEIKAKRFDRHGLFPYTNFEEAKTENLDTTIIDQIEQVRTENNHNWMQLLRLTVKYAPEEAKEIFNKITECDIKINKLMRRINETTEMD